MTRNKDEENALMIVGCLYVLYFLFSLGLIGAIIWGIVALILHFT